jgi:predicted RNase H-like nuclease
MVRVAGADSTPGGWSVVFHESGRLRVEKVATLFDIVGFGTKIDIVAVDIPIGLLDAYELGGRACDRAARKLLGLRRSSVFPAPVRSVLTASTYQDACARSRTSSPSGKKISKQTYAIVSKIEQVDDLLQKRPDLRTVVREVHPEVCFRELVGQPMRYPKSKQPGREEREQALHSCFPNFDEVIKAGREKHLPLTDVLDAAVACWSALRLAVGKGQSLTEPIPQDTTGLPMTIWV